jgi:hypothetical protein
MYRVDIAADLNDADQTGYLWTFLSNSGAELGLQLLDAPAGRGLGQVQGGRSPGEAAAAGDREKRLNVIELDRIP